MSINSISQKVTQYSSKQIALLALVIYIISAILIISGVKATKSR
jgi:hypothetical protein